MKMEELTDMLHANPIHTEAGIYALMLSVMKILISRLRFHTLMANC